MHIYKITTTDKCFNCNSEISEYLVSNIKYSNEDFGKLCAKVERELLNQKSIYLGDKLIKHMKQILIKDYNFEDLNPQGSFHLY